MSSKLAVAFVGAALLLGCATPAPVFHLEPHARDAIWSKGRPSVRRESNGVRVTAAFGFQDRDLMAVRIQVENQTDGELEIDASNVLYAACSGVQSASCTVYTHVVDPEARLAEGALRVAAGSVGGETFSFAYQQWVRRFDRNGEVVSESQRG